MTRNLKPWKHKRYETLKLTPRVVAVLRCIVEDDDVAYAKYIVDVTGLTPSTVAHILPKLEKLGLIACKTSDQDRRVKYLLPTQTGMDLVDSWGSM